MSDIVVKATVISQRTVREPKAPKPKRIWDNFEEVGEVIKSDREKLVVAAAVRDGVKYLNIREFYFKKSEGAWKPGFAGITIPIRRPVDNGTKIIEPYWDFMDLLAKAAMVARDLELADESKAIYYIPKEKKDETTDT